MDAGKCGAWRHVAGASITVAYRTSTTLTEKSGSTCSEGDTFVGQSVTAQDGTLWLVNETNGLFLPLVHPETQTLLFEEVSWECLHNGTVRGRQTPNLPDMSETVIETGHVISALPVPEHPGWLIEAGSNMYFPMHHPQTGVVLFKPKTSAASGCQKDLMVQEARNIQQRDGGFSGATFLHQKATADHWGVTLANLEDFFATVEEKLRSGTLQNVGRPYDESQFRSSSVGPNMYQVNEQVIMPVTVSAGPCEVPQRGHLSLTLSRMPGQKACSNLGTS